MFKIYPDKYVNNQLIVKSSNLEIIFTLLEEYLGIIYWELHIQIPKTSIIGINIEGNNENNFKKIFLKLQNNINMEYILFSSESEMKNIINFFKEFKLINEK